MAWQIMGCKSYAEFAIRPNMAASADVVMSFLEDLSNIVKYKPEEVWMDHILAICIAVFCLLKFIIKFYDPSLSW